LVRQAASNHRCCCFGCSTREALAPPWLRCSSSCMSRQPPGPICPACPSAWLPPSQPGRSASRQSPAATGRGEGRCDVVGCSDQQSRGAHGGTRPHARHQLLRSPAQPAAGARGLPHPRRLGVLLHRLPPALQPGPPSKHAGPPKVLGQNLCGRRRRGGGLGEHAGQGAASQQRAHNSPCLLPPAGAARRCCAHPRLLQGQAAVHR
jgi:hypothetical protein